MGDARPIMIFATEPVSAAYAGQVQMIDSSSIRVHQHRQRQKGGPEPAEPTAGTVSHGRCMGRSRGGLTTKIHVLADANGLPVMLKLSPGQAHDGRSAGDMLDGIGKDQILRADAAYDSEALRQSLASRGAQANVKPMPGRINGAVIAHSGDSSHLAHVVPPVGLR